MCVTSVTCEVRVCGLRCRGGSSLYIPCVLLRLRHRPKDLPDSTHPMQVKDNEAITCPKEEILRRLQRETTCSSCCSALRVMIQRPLHQLLLLESFVSHEDTQGYVLKEHLASPKSLEEACAKFPLHEWLKNCQPLKRCLLYTSPSPRDRG